MSELTMHPARRACFLAAACFIASTSPLPAGAGVLELTFRVEDSAQTFAPLHSAVHGEHAGDLLFFGGLKNMGLHGINGFNPDGGIESFPLTHYNDDVIVFDPATGTMTTGTLTNLSDTIRTALLVSNASAYQDGSTLYLYGGFGPLLDNTDWTTRDTIVAIDLDAVRTAVLAASPIPPGAFTLTTNAQAQVAGAHIISMGDTFALIGGADFLYDYGLNGIFYAERMQIFDTASSFLTASQTINDIVNLHRRDMNAHPCVLPDGIGGTELGFAITGGVFNNIFPYTNPITYRKGDPAVVDHAPYEQKMSIYESPSVSFYRASEDRNRFVMFSGISANHYDRDLDTFTYDFLGPWSREITEMRMEAGAFVGEYIMDDMEDPTTNTSLILEAGIPVGVNGQVLLDLMPANEVLLGRIYGGLKSSAEGHSPPFGGTATSWASTTIHDVYLVVGVRGDINRDGVTDTADLGLMISTFGGTGLADLNLDGVVDTADLGILISNFGANTPG
jgi:hypothetical protein